MLPQKSQGVSPGLPVPPERAVEVAEEVGHDLRQVALHGPLVVGDDGRPDVAHGPLHGGVRVVLVAIQSWHDRLQVGGQLLLGVRGNGREAIGCALGGELRNHNQVVPKRGLKGSHRLEVKCCGSKVKHHNFIH